MPPPSPPDPARSRRPPLSPRGRRWLAGAGLALLGLLLLRALLPFALAWAIPWVAQRSAGARVEIDDIDLGLLAGSVRVEGLRVANPADAEGTGGPIDAGTALLALDRLDANLAWLDLPRGRIRLESVELVAPRGRLVQADDGSFVVPQPPAADEVPAEPAPADPAAAATPETTAAPESAPAEPTPAPPETPAEAAAPGPPEGEDADGGGEAAEEEPGGAAGEDDWEIVLDRLEAERLDLRIERGADGAEMLHAAFDQLSLDGLGFGAEGIRLGGIALRRPQLGFERGWALAQARRPPEPEAPPTTGGGPPGFAARRVLVESAGLVVRTPRGPLEIALRFEARDLDLERGSRFPVSLELEGKGKILLEGRLGLDPLFFAGRLRWSDLSLPPLTLAAYPEVIPWVKSSHADGELLLTLRTSAEGAPTGLSLRGSSRIAGLVLSDPASDDLTLAWEQLEVSLRDGFVPFAPGTPARFDVERVTLVAPRLVATRPPESVDRLLALFSAEAAPAPGEAAPARAEAAAEPAPEPAGAPAAEATPPAPAAPGARVRVREFELRGGEVNLRDRTVSPTHETEIRDLGIVARGIATPGPTVESLELDGLIQQTGQLALTGSVHDGDGKLELDVTRLDLGSYDSLARQAGWQISSGEGSLRSSLRMSGSRYASDNAVVLHDLRVSTQNPGAFQAGFGISLDLALALLRGPGGDIALDVPISWKENQLGVGLESVLVDALRQALLGTLTTPFKLVGMVLPDAGGPPSFEPVPFAPGATVPADEARGRLRAIARLLKSRPELGLSLRGQHAPADLPGFALALLRERAATGEGLPEVEGDGFFARRRVEAALRERAEGGRGDLEPEDEALLERYVAAQPVSAEQRRAFADQRAEAVRERLLAEGAPPEALAPGPPLEAEAPGVLLQLRTRRALAERSP